MDFILFLRSLTVLHDYTQSIASPSSRHISRHVKSSSTDFSSLRVIKNSTLLAS